MSPDRQDEPIFSNEGYRPPVVLVVEDEVLVRFDIADFLRRQGYTVLEAATADEARTVLTDLDEIGVVFSDINMPGALDGAELAKWMASERPLIPIILTSGIRSTLEAAGQSLANIVAIIDKPYSYETVDMQIRAVFAQRAEK